FLAGAALSFDRAGRGPIFSCPAEGTSSASIAASNHSAGVVGLRGQRAHPGVDCPHWPRAEGRRRTKGDQAMNQVARSGIVVPALLVLVSGCATKKWVNETMTQRETATAQRVDQQFEQRDTKLGDRIGAVEGRVNGESQRVDGMGQRLGTMETSVGQ